MKISPESRIQPNLSRKNNIKDKQITAGALVYLFIGIKLHKMFSSRWNSQIPYLTEDREEIYLYVNKTGDVFI